MTKLLLKFFAVVFLFMGMCFLFALGNVQQDIPKTYKLDRASYNLSRTLFYFIENKGQIDGHVNFHIKMPHGNVLFSGDYIDYQFFIENQKKNTAVESQLIDRGIQKDAVLLENVRLCFVNPNQEVRVKGTQASQAVFNFYKGNDPNKWVDGAASYRKLVYEELWPHIDLVVYGHQGKLKHEYVVRPGGDVNDILFTYEGVESIAVKNSRQLEIKTSTRILKEDVPISYQMTEGEKSLVATEFKIKDRKSVGFNVEAYNSEKELIIDPSLIYSSFLGGSSYDTCQDIVIDTHLDAYVVGTTSSTNFPTTPGAYDKVLNGNDAFIAKFDSTGVDLLFSTYFGGSNNDSGSSIVYSWGDDGPVICGTTYSNDMPTHPNAYDKRLNGSTDVFVAKFTSSGQFKYATYLGGSSIDFGQDMGLDGSGNIFVGGLTCSADFVTTPGVIDPVYDPPIGYNIYITKFNSQLSSLGYSTFLGQDDMIFGGISADYKGNAYIVGAHYDVSCEQKIPTTPGVYGENLVNGWGDGFITKIAPDGKSLVFSTYMENGVLWEDKRYADGVDVDGAGNVYVITHFRYDYGPYYSIAVKKYNADGSAKLFDKGLYSEINHIGNAWPVDIALDGRGGVYVIGYTNAEEFEVTKDAFQSTLAGGRDSFIVKLDANNGNKLYSTYFGGSENDYGHGIAADSFGAVYVAGSTYSPDFPTTPGSYSMNYHGNADGFVARIRDGGPEGKLKLNKDSLLFTVPYQTEIALKKDIGVRNIGKGVANYNIYTDQNWLSVNPSSGDVRKETDVIAVTVTSTSKMKPGTHAGAVKVYSVDAYNSPQSVLVKLKIKGPAIKLNRKKFSVTAEEGGDNPDPFVFLIRNKGPGTLRYRIKAIDSWLSTSRKQGVSTGERDKIKIFIDITGMTAGTYTGSIEITAKGTVDPPEVIEVNLTITD